MPDTGSVEMEQRLVGLAEERRPAVAQTVSLLYCGLVIQEPLESAALADCQSAKQQTDCLR